MDIPVASADVLLNRFLYISETECAYVPGNVFVHQYKKNKETVFDLIQEIQNKAKHDLIDEIFKKYINSGRLLNNNNAIFVLAMCCRRGDIKTSSMCYKLMPTICKTSSELMLFVKFMCNDFVDTKRGFGKGMRKAISKWYLSHNPLELAKEVGFCKSKHGRTHKDVLTMAHVKTENESINSILAYAVCGYKKTKEKYSALQSLSEMPHFKLLADLNDFKSCDDPDKASKFIEVFCFPVTLTPTQMIKSRQVWEAAVNNFSLLEAMFYLHRLQNMGFLTASNINSKKILPKILSFLKDKSLIEKSKIHPLQAYILLQNYENGGKPLKYPKSEHKKKNISQKPSEPPNSKIVSALKAMVDTSLTTHNEIGARFMITLDTRTQMFEGKCCQNPNVSPAMAGIVIALALARREKEVTVAVFTEHGVQPVGLNNCSLKQAVDKVKAVKAGHAKMYKPIEWCINKKKKIDIFINVMESPVRNSAANEDNKDRKCVVQELMKYRSRMNIPNCKLASMFFGCHNPAIGGNYLGCIDFGGLDENIPKIIEHFAQNNFN